MSQKAECIVTPKQFLRYVDRDRGCVHCGRTDTIVPHHRANRGMGGSKVRDVPSNIIVMCSYWNGAMESDARAAEVARKYGWKLSGHDTPKDRDVYYPAEGVWYRLDDDYGKELVSEHRSDIASASPLESDPGGEAGADRDS